MNMSSPGLLRNAAASAFTSYPLTGLWREISGHRVTIFMLHRFSDPEQGVEGHEPKELDARLDHLRARGYPLLSLFDVVAGLQGNRRLPEEGVVFTVDDGYYDFYEIGRPVFERHGCPVTVFLPTRFVDGDVWLWWDKVEYLFGLAPEAGEIDLPIHGGRRYWTSDSERRSLEHDVVQDLHRVSYARVTETLDSLARQLGVTVPDRPPPRYRSMDWSHVQSAESSLISFGPHTATHPLLSRVDDERARREISRSWRALRARTSNPVPIFCYPNGAPETYTSRSKRYARDAGLVGALTSQPGYVPARRGEPPASMQSFELPRFAYPGDRRSMVQVVTGLEKVKRTARRRLPGSGGS